MKQTLIALLLLVAIASRGQQTILFPSMEHHPCGTWERQPEDTTAWLTVDTLGKKENFSPERHWIYDTWNERPFSGWTDAVYRPCGWGDPYIMQQYRVCSITGIRQIRERFTAYKYIEAPITEYERVRDSLNATVSHLIHFSDTIVVGHLGRSVNAGDSIIYWGGSIVKPAQKKKAK